MIIKLVRLIIFKVNRVKAQKLRKIREYFQPRIMKIVAATVATPFPPLNLSQIGKICPSTGEIETRAICQSWLK